MGDLQTHTIIFQSNGNTFLRIKSIKIKAHGGLDTVHTKDQGHSSKNTVPSLLWHPELNIPQFIISIWSHKLTLLAELLQTEGIQTEPQALGNLVTYIVSKILVVT